MIAVSEKTMTRMQRTKQSVCLFIYIKEEDIYSMHVPEVPIMAMNGWGGWLAGTINFPSLGVFYHLRGEICKFIIIKGRACIPEINRSQNPKGHFAPRLRLATKSKYTTSKFARRDSGIIYSLVMIKAVNMALIIPPRLCQKHLPILPLSFSLSPTPPHSLAGGRNERRNNAKR